MQMLIRIIDFMRAQIYYPFLYYSPIASSLFPTVISTAQSDFPLLSLFPGCPSPFARDPVAVAVFCGSSLLPSHSFPHLPSPAQLVSLARYNRTLRFLHLYRQKDELKRSRGCRRDTRFLFASLFRGILLSSPMFLHADMASKRDHYKRSCNSQTV